VLMRLAYLDVTNALALLRLLPMSDRDKDAEILVLRYQVMVLERQLRGERVRFTRADRAWLAALLHRLPRDMLRNLRLLVRPETVMRLASGSASPQACQDFPAKAGRTATHCSVDRADAAPGPGDSTRRYRRTHGELHVLVVKVAASTVWEILQQAAIDPAPTHRHQLGDVPAFAGAGQCRTSGVRMQGIISIMERWIQACRDQYVLLPE
jgi:hypothetical protein